MGCLQNDGVPWYAWRALRSRQVCDPIARVLVGESPLILNTTCKQAGFEMGPAPRIPSKLNGDSFFGQHSTIFLWTSDVVAFVAASRVLFHEDSLRAVADNGAQWRRDNPQCDMK